MAQQLASTFAKCKSSDRTAFIGSVPPSLLLSTSKKGPAILGCGRGQCLGIRQQGVKMRCSLQCSEFMHPSFSVLLHDISFCTFGVAAYEIGKGVLDACGMSRHGFPFYVTTGFMEKNDTVPLLLAMQEGGAD
eukprot:3937385-Rhodomonas_salina.1